MRRVMIGLMVFGALIVIWLFRPWFHDVIMSLYVHPLVPVLWVVALGLAIPVWRWGLRQLKDNSKRAGAYWGTCATVFIIGFVLISIISAVVGSFEGDLRYAKAAKELEFSTRTTLPTMQPVRLMPKQVATRLAEDAFQNPQEYLGDSQIALVDGKLTRVFPRLPDGLYLALTRKLTGFVTTDVSRLERDVAIEDSTFTYAEGIGVFDNLYYRLYLEKYFVDFVPEPIYLKDDQGEWVTVVPYLTYHGFLIRTPAWGGFFLVYPDGRMEDHPPADAERISWLRGNRIFPKELARYSTESFAYRKGLLNYWFIHEDQTEIADPALGVDQTTAAEQGIPVGEVMPYHIATDEGLKQFLAAKPAGASYGVYKIFLFDATTGALEVIEYPTDSLLTGPSVAADYVRRQFPLLDWSSFYLSEPRPATVQGQLYWLLSIVPNDAAGVSKTIFLNAATNEVHEFNTTEEISAFLTGATVPVAPTTQPTESSTDAVDPAALRARLDELQRSLDALKELVPAPAEE